MAERKAGTKKSDEQSADTTDTVQETRGDAEAKAVNTQAAPLDAPLVRAVLGNPDSSTNFASANAALRSVPGSQHVRLFDDDGQDVDPEALFEFPAPDSPSMLAKVPRRVYQEFIPPQATTHLSHLYYPAGATVPVMQARQVRDALQLLSQAPAAK